MELDCLKGAPAGQKKVSAASDPAAISASKGSVTLQELRLPLKADFVCSTANRPGTHLHCTRDTCAVRSQIRVQVLAFAVLCTLMY